MRRLRESVGRRARVPIKEFTLKSTDPVGSHIPISDGKLPSRREELFPKQNQATSIIPPIVEENI